MPLPLAGLLGGLSGGTGGLAGIGTALASIGQIKGAFTGLAGKAVTVTKGMAGIVTGLPGLGTALGLFNSVADQFNQLTGFLTKFVGAINPGQVQLFDITMRDLTATVGFALQPALQAATMMVRSFADTLFPLAQQAFPLVQKWANGFYSVGERVISAFGKMLEKAMPLIEVVEKVAGAVREFVGTLLEIGLDSVGQGFENFMTLLKPFAFIIDGVIERLNILGEFLKVMGAAVIEVGKALWQFISSVLSGLFGADIKDISDALTTAFRALAKAVIMTTARFFSLIGFTSGIQAMLKALKGGDPAKKQSTIGLAAPQNPQYKEIEAMGKDIRQASFAASIFGKNAEPKKEQVEYLEGIEGKLTELLKNPYTLEKLKEDLRKELIDLPAKIGSALYEALKKRIAEGKKDIYEGGKAVLTDPIGTGLDALRRLGGM